MAELARRRQAMLIEEAQRKKRRNILIVAVSIAVVLLLVWALAGNARLGTLASDAEAKQAQIKNVLERQQTTLEVWNNAPESPEKRAKISGTENRVRIERRHYDEAARSFPGSLWRR